MLRSAIKFSSWAGGGPRLAVLTFHRVLAEKDPILAEEVDRAEFRAFLTAWGRWFRFAPLSESVKSLREGSLQTGTACITFDDGYADNLLVAAPVLRELGIPATFFVATQYSDGGTMFNDRVIAAVQMAKGETIDLGALELGVLPIGSVAQKRAAIANLLSKIKHLDYQNRETISSKLVAHLGVTLHPQPMMTRAQVRELAQMGFEIGAHTVSHPILREIDDQRAREEIVQSRAKLQALTGQKVEMFAYPNGRPGEDYDFRHVQMVKAAGFVGAVSTIHGAASASDDLFQIPRFTPWYGTSWKSGVQFIQNFRTPIRALKPA